MDNKKKRVVSKTSAEAAKLIKIFAENPFSSFNYKQVSKRLGLKEKAARKAVSQMIWQLEKDKVIVETKIGKYKINSERLSEFVSRKSYITGTVDMKQTGKAYVIPDDGTEDIQISAANTGQAFNRDKVKVFIFPKRKDKKTEGQIVEILARNKTKFVGTIQVLKNFAFLTPDNKAVPVDFFIPLNKLNGAVDGDKAIAELGDWPSNLKNPFGEIINILGKPGDNNVEMQSILAEFDFPLSFMPETEKEAKSFSKNIAAAEIAKRKDFRKTTTFTIDPADAKDFDDALSIKTLPNKNYEIGIHIADVSFYVRNNTSLDREAYTRGTSVYLVDRTVPMLPETLSNDLCSLKPNEERLAFSVVLEMTPEGKILNEWIGKTVIKSDRRFTYEEVQKIIEESKGEYSKEVLTLHKLATVFRDERLKKNSINFFTEEVKFRLDEKGNPMEIYIKEQKDSHRLVEDFMLIANMKVAELIGKKKGNEQIKTFVYRIHDKPSPERLESFKNFVASLGYKVRIDSPRAISETFNKLFEKIIDKPEGNIITSLAIRTMAKAIYSTDNIGHYGLSFAFYTHFTSPIRRYPDLIVHRLLEAYLFENKPSVDKAEYEKKCRHCTDMEKKAVDAERTSVKYKQVEFMKDKVGQVFDGVISGVSKWGLYVEINENKCEGMVFIRDLEDDFYYLDEAGFKFIGSKFGKVYQLGDAVNIQIKKADLSRKHLDFLLV